MRVFLLVSLEHKEEVPYGAIFPDPLHPVNLSGTASLVDTNPDACLIFRVDEVGLGGWVVMRVVMMTLMMLGCRWR